MYPSVLPFVTSVMRLMPGIPYFVDGPSPIPFAPWHGSQFTWKYFLPFWSDATLMGVGLAIPAIESIVPGSALYET